MNTSIAGPIATMQTAQTIDLMNLLSKEVKAARKNKSKGYPDRVNRVMKFLILEQLIVKGYLAKCYQSNEGKEFLISKNHINYDRFKELHKLIRKEMPDVPQQQKIDQAVLSSYLKAKCSKDDQEYRVLPKQEDQAAQEDQSKNTNGDEMNLFGEMNLYDPTPPKFKHYKPKQFIIPSKIPTYNSIMLKGTEHLIEKKVTFQKQ